MRYVYECSKSTRPYHEAGVVKVVTVSPQRFAAMQNSGIRYSNRPHPGFTEGRVYFIEGGRASWIGFYLQTSIPQLKKLLDYSTWLHFCTQENIIQTVSKV